MRSEPQICIVLSQAQAVFRPACEHTVGFRGPSGYKIIDQDADVRLFASQEEGIPSLDFQHGVNSCHESLCSGFLVSRGAVDLASKVEVANPFGLERRVQLTGWAVIVFDGVARAQNLSLLKAGDGPDKGILDLIGKARRDAVHIDFPCVSPLGLQKDLVTWFFRELHDLILDGGAVAGTYPVDDSGIEWGLMKILPDDAVGFFRGVGDPAGDLFHMELFSIMVIQGMHLILFTNKSLRNMRKEWQRGISLLSLAD